METRFLETFLTVVECGSLAEASRRLGITPVAVAQRIQSLEDEIGQSILARAGRRVRPTEAGRAIIENSQRILAEVRRLKGTALNEAPSGELRLGAISTALIGMLPDALLNFYEAAPGVDMFLLPGTSADLYQRMLDGKIDAAIVVKPPFALPKTLEWKLLKTEQFVLLAPKSIAHRSAVRLLAEQPFIRYDRSNWGGRLVDGYIRRLGLKPREWLELDSLESIAMMVEAGLGVSLMPDWSPSFHDKLNIERLTLENPLYREIGIIRPRHAQASRVIAMLIDAIQA